MSPTMFFRFRIYSVPVGCTEKINETSSTYTTYYCFPIPTLIGIEMVKFKILSSFEVVILDRTYIAILIG